MIFLPVSAAEGHRGLHSERGASPTPSGQLQGRQQESQEAPASLVHPFLTYPGQRPVGGGEQEGGGAGQKGVKGGFPEEGFVLSRSCWLRLRFLLRQQLRQQCCHHK